MGRLEGYGSVLEGVSYQRFGGGFFPKYSSFNNNFVMKFLSKYQQCLLWQHSTAFELQELLTLILLLPLSNKFSSAVQAVPRCVNDISTNQRKKPVLYFTWEVMDSGQSPSPGPAGAVYLMQGLQRASRHDTGVREVRTLVKLGRQATYGISKPHT